MYNVKINKISADINPGIISEKSTSFSSARLNKIYHGGFARRWPSHEDKAPIFTVWERRNNIKRREWKTVKFKSSAKLRISNCMMLNLFFSFINFYVFELSVHNFITSSSGEVFNPGDGYDTNTRDISVVPLFYEVFCDLISIFLNISA